MLQIGNRVIRKRIHVRIEHVQPSRCREEFLRRKVSNDLAKSLAKEKGGTRSASLQGGSCCQFKRRLGDMHVGGKAAVLAQHQSRRVP
jgi:hypothetical protein